MTEEQRRRQAWATLHRSRHNPDAAPPSRFMRWFALVELREVYRGEMRPDAWSALLNGTIDALNAGRPVWPIYARWKREVEPAEERSLVPDAVTGGGDSTGRLAGALVGALNEIADRRERGELA